MVTHHIISQKKYSIYVTVINAHNNVFVEHILDVLFICLCSWVRHIYWNCTKEHISCVPNLTYGIQCIMYSVMWKLLIMFPLNDEGSNLKYHSSYHIKKNWKAMHKFW